MRLPIRKILKLSVYGLAAVGVLTVFMVVLHAFGSMSGQAYRSSSEIGLSAPMAASAPSLTQGFDFDFFDGIADESSSRKKTSSESQPSGEGELTQRKVVRDGALVLLVENPETMVADVRSLAQKYKGFVAASRVYEISEGLMQGSITIRIPAENFDTVMEQIKKMAVDVEDENVSAKDVTEQFVDLEAQLTNLRAEEEQYRNILKDADTIPDTLQIVQHLNRTRGQIERLEGQLRYLSSQVDLSSITVSLTAEADVVVFGLRWRPLVVAKQAFRDLLGGLAGYVDTIIRLVFVLPLFIVWGATIGIGTLIAWRLFLWGRRRWPRNRP